MLELELFLDESLWNQSWLTHEVEISTNTEKFSGIITAEIFSWVDDHTIRAVLTVETSPTLLPPSIPSVVTAHNTDIPDLKTVAPSAGTSWPIPDHTEILLSQNMAIGALYNHAMQDPVCENNYSQHILRANKNTAFVMDDSANVITFTYAENQFQLDKNITLTNPSGNIVIHSHHLNYHAQDKTIETIGGNVIFQIKENYTTTTQSGNIQVNTSHLFNNTAEQNIFFNAGKDLQFESKDIHWVSHDAANFQSSQLLALENQGSIEIQSGQDITIVGEKIITLHQEGNTLEITAHGITVTANQVTVSGQLILSVMPI